MGANLAMDAIDSAVSTVWSWTGCGGPTLSFTGSGSGNSCSEALQAAQNDAIVKSFAGYPNCSPCQTSAGAQSCATPSCYPGPCPLNSYSATYTLNYKCQSCQIFFP